MIQQFLKKKRRNIESSMKISNKHLIKRKRNFKKIILICKGNKVGGKNCLTTVLVML